MAEYRSTSPSGFIAMSCVLSIICIIVVYSRFHVRLRQETSVWIDDWIMLPALALFIGMCACDIAGVHERVYGYPTPVALKKTDPAAYHGHIEYLGKVITIFQFLQIPTLGCIRLGALLFYHRIFCFKGHPGAFRMLNFVSMVIVILWTIAMLMMGALRCGTHFSALWIGAKAYVEYCIYAFHYILGFAISDFLLDLLVILLPIPKIWSLHLNIRRKLAVTGVFGLALVGLTASTMRMVQYVRILADGPSLTLDLQLGDTEISFWATLEAGLSLIAVNLPSLWAIISKTSPASLLASLRSVTSLGSREISPSRFRIPEGEEAAYAESTHLKNLPADQESGSEWHNMHHIASQVSLPLPSPKSGEQTGVELVQNDARI